MATTLDSDDRFRIYVWIICAVTVVVIIMCIFVYGWSKAQLIKEMTIAGVDPIEAKIAISSGTSFQAEATGLALILKYNGVKNGNGKSE